MAAGNMADGVDHGQHGQAESDGHADEPDAGAGEGRGEDGGAAPAQDQPERAYQLRGELFRQRHGTPSSSIGCRRPVMLHEARRHAKRPDPTRRPRAARVSANTLLFRESPCFSSKTGVATAYQGCNTQRIIVGTCSARLFSLEIPVAATPRIVGERRGAAAATQADGGPIPRSRSARAQAPPLLEAVVPHREDLAPGLLGGERVVDRALGEAEAVVRAGEYFELVLRVDLVTRLSCSTTDRQRRTVAAARRRLSRVTSSAASCCAGGRLPPPRRWPATRLAATGDASLRVPSAEPPAHRGHS